MQTRTQLERQYLGCGYEPPADARVRLSVWQPPSSARGYHGPALTVCAGYTANLPEVTEAAIARAHWKHGSLRDSLEGATPSEDLTNSILVLDSSYSEVEGWLMTPVSEGGGGK